MGCGASQAAVVPGGAPADGKDVPGSGRGTALTGVSDPTPVRKTKSSKAPAGAPPGALLAGRTLEEQFSDDQLRQWNVSKLLQRLAAAAADDGAASLPTWPARGAGLHAAALLSRRAGAAGAAGVGVGEEDMAADSRKQVHECAVSLEFLLEFAREIPDEWRTGQVVQDLVKGYTAPRQSRFTDMMPCRHVKRPDYFISHKWDSPFHYMVRSVRDHPSGAVPSEVYVWVDIFAVNQHPGQEQDDDLAQLNTAITNASGGTLVVLDHQAGPLGRVWCLFEIWITVRDKGLGALHLLTYGFTNNDIRDCFQAIDVKTARATNEADRLRILRYIERSYESLDEFNEMLKLLFLLGHTHPHCTDEGPRARLNCLGPRTLSAAGSCSTTLRLRLYHVWLALLASCCAQPAFTHGHAPVV
ncbi:hypothetical protein HYH03_017080 [Edaphochlamys debaryana]|uniref:Uncharacterized protein n=1 Tax=Edaphochlamys debaryana TaxID=47281 RepID=A0A836BPG5_9CHLO|nr:hypothetical protein HYH03_017080 [Edaphochlamys debaryana]|eukprot:KAG2484060.1 hypothetical protein HYH03_017080 [Edaphochlamys debaryana]